LVIDVLDDVFFLLLLMVYIMAGWRLQGVVHTARHDLHYIEICFMEPVCLWFGGSGKDSVRLRYDRVDNLQQCKTV